MSVVVVVVVMKTVGERRGGGFKAENLSSGVPSVIQSVHNSPNTTGNSREGLPRGKVCLSDEI